MRCHSLKLLSISVVLIACRSWAATWYVDNAATGAANGTNWANAWTNFPSMVWGGAGIVAGDTVYISGGSTSKTYTNEMTVGASGTSGNPITILVGQETGHDGVVFVDGTTHGTNYCQTNAISMHRNYITINGAVGGQPHLVLRNWFNATNKNFAYGIKGSPAHFANVTHCVISNVNTAIMFPSSTNITVGYCNMTAWGDAVISMNGSYSSPPNSWDASMIFSNRFYCVYNEASGGPDGVQGGDGISIFHNWFETLQDDTLTNRVSNHVDFYQSDGGKYVKIYNNWCHNIGDSCFSPAPWTAGKGLFNVQIYNNIFEITQQMDSYPNYVRMYNTSGFGGYTNVHILNNLFLDNTNGNTIAVYFGSEEGSAPGTNNVFANNIFVNVGAANSFAWDFATNNGAAQSEWTLTNNILYHATPAHARVKYLGTNYTAAQWMAYDPSTGTNLPSFTRYTAYATNNVYTLLPYDTAALNTGLLYSNIFTSDYNGTTRGATWDMGPYEYTESSPTCDYSPKTSRAFSVVDSDSIRIVWPTNQYRTIVEVSRRVYTNRPSQWANWTALWTNSTTAEYAGSYDDTNITAGIHYEYKLASTVTNWVCAATNNSWRTYQFISTGINVPLTETNGNIILLVESAVAASLVSELNMLTNDLHASGYNVFRHDVAASDVTDAGWTNAVASTKALVVADWNTDTNADWTLYIIGHVPIPYAGLSSPGSHTENYGAHSADWYYADMVESGWTDTTANDTTADYAYNYNVPGDGKFDQTYVPAAPQFRVGRVDFRNMPGFGKTEVQLLSQYLTRAHNWKTKQFSVRDKGLIIATTTRPFEAHGRQSSFLGGSGSTDFGNWLTLATNLASSYMFASSRGSGQFTHDDELGWTTNFASTNLFAAFTSMHGSYYGDYDSAMQSNIFVMASLASAGCTLANYYQESRLLFDSPAMNLPVVQRMFEHAHNFFSGAGAYYSAFATYSGAWFDNKERAKNYTQHLGDPTIKMRVVAPPLHSYAVRSGTDVIVSWTNSYDSATGYYVDRAPTSNLNAFVRLTGSPTNSPYTDSGASSGNWTYRIRAVKLEDSANRSFYDTSLGALASYTGSRTMTVTGNATIGTLIIGGQ